MDKTYEIVDEKPDDIRYSVIKEFDHIMDNL
jgi:hypothetical protein